MSFPTPTSTLLGPRCTPFPFPFPFLLFYFSTSSFHFTSLALLLCLQCLRLRDGFNQLLTQHPRGEFPVKTMVEEVMTDTVKDQEPHVFPPETQYHLSSIFVDIPTPAVTLPSFLPSFFIFALSMNIYEHPVSWPRGVMGPEASLPSPSSPMVRSVSTRGILNQAVVPGRSTLNTL